MPKDEKKKDFQRTKYITFQQQEAYRQQIKVRSNPFQ